MARNGIRATRFSVIDPIQLPENIISRDGNNGDRMKAIQKLSFEVSKSTCVLSCEHRTKEVVENISLLSIRICNLAPIHDLLDLFGALIFFYPLQE